MQKTNFIFLLAAILSLTACSSKGMMTAGHNGKKYWNPGNCKTYRYYNNNPDVIHCTTDGKANGTTLRPVDQQQLDNYYREKELSSSESSSESNTVQCVKFGDISFNKKIHTFNGTICPLGYLKN